VPLWQFSPMSHTAVLEGAKALTREVDLNYRIGKIKKERKLTLNEGQKCERDI